ncbi:MAG: chromosomal replication initiator protein DnaA, partial [Piscirickettsiaceae bacterium CG_4_10_14_0_2_um_filter_44_336]
MTTPLWPQVLNQLESVLNNQQVSTWIRPLEAVEEEATLRLIAPSGFILDWVNKKLLSQIKQAVSMVVPVNPPEVVLEVGEYAI